MPSSLTDPGHAPDDADLRAALGAARPAWDAILAYLAGREGLTREWKFYAGGHGWQLKIKDKKAAVLYLIPRDGSFLAAMPLKDAAVAALPGTDLPADVIRAIQTAKPAVEGRPARIEVTGARQADIVKTLLALALATRQQAPARSEQIVVS
jgi:hypothetical protein